MRTSFCYTSYVQFVAVCLVSIGEESLNGAWRKLHDIASAVRHFYQEFGKRDVLAKEGFAQFKCQICAVVAIELEEDEIGTVSGSDDVLEDEHAGL